MVLAHYNGIVRGVFRPTRWMEATQANFPWLGEDLAGRWGFEGKRVEPATEERYIRKRVPEEYRRKGAANPVRYVDP